MADLDVRLRIHPCHVRKPPTGELARVDTQLLNLSEILRGLTGRERQTVLRRCDVWLDRRLEITGS